MKLAFVVWCILWAWIALPWRSFSPVPSFRRVALIPSFTGSIRSQFLNVLAFVPLGIIGARLGWRPTGVVLLAAGVSAASEVLQLFSTRRYPSTTDVILNTAGALIGYMLVRAFGHSRAQRDSDVRPSR
jgi:glycopeptide antibiotics resistance protein